MKRIVINEYNTFQALLVLDYLIKNGAERVIQECRARIIQLKTLTEFQYYDEEDKDVGASIRVRAKQLVELLHDDKRIEAERKNAAAVRDRFGQAISSESGRIVSSTYSGYGSSSYGSRSSRYDDYPGNYRR